MAELPPLVGQSQAFIELLENVSRLAVINRPVLIVGERGTGKELVAARLHFLSRRWARPFVKLNCAAIPETLIEAELFGHEAGAFTGAARRRRGRFEQADQGTFFLDEIGNATAAVQEKVLHVIEYGEFERVGSDESVSVDVRVIAATNEDLPRAVEEGRMRADLLDRLTFDVLNVPALRTRAGDVPILATHFGLSMARELGWSEFPGFTAEAMARLEAYPWPGNVRELRNVVERAVARTDPETGEIDAIVFDPFQPLAAPMDRGSGKEEESGGRETAAPSLPDPHRPFDMRGAVRELEAHLLGEALRANRYNQRATARHLGLSYHQLRNDLRKHGLLGTVEQGRSGQGESGQGARAAGDSS